MNNKISIFLLFLLCFIQSVSAQFEMRKPFKGQVYNDSLRVENVVVFNINAQKGTTVDTEGNFEIPIRANDTLFFSSLSFLPEKILITEREIGMGFVKVPMTAIINKLQEVVITTGVKPRLSGNKEIINTQYTPDEKTTIRNPHIYTGEIIDGIDFVAIIKGISQKVKSKKQKESPKSVPFTEVAMDKIDYGFYKSTLKLKDEEIRLFLYYCEKDVPNAIKFQRSSTFELMEFLIEKNKEYAAFKKKL